VKVVGVFVRFRAPLPGIGLPTSPMNFSKTSEKGY
jgi:hypothetical protein